MISSLERGTCEGVMLQLALLGCGCTAPVGPMGVVFNDVTGAAGLPSAGGHCLLFRDFDGDGAPDLVTTEVDANGVATGVLLAYRNRGDGAFERHEARFDSGYGGLCSAVDLDRNGLPDVVLIDPIGGVGILQNLGGLRFEPLSGFIDPVPPHTSAAGFFDYDNDGWPDLILGTYNAEGQVDGAEHCSISDTSIQCWLDPQKVTAPSQPIVYHNDGGRHFTRTTLETLLPAYALDFDFIDWDGDGLVDAFGSNDYGVNAFYRNLGGAAFADMLPSLEANVQNAGMGAVFTDFNRDGLWDIFVSNGGADELWLGRPDGTLEDHRVDFGLVPATSTKLGWGAAAGDFDNDGYMDVFEASCITYSSLDALRTLSVNPGALEPGDISATQSHFVFMNRGGTHFDTTLLSVPPGASASRGAIGVADYDGDGRLDVAVVTTTLHLYHNETPTDGRHFINVLVREPNATVIVADEAGEIERAVTANRGNLGGSEEPLHFGLGERTSVASITVRWPGGAHKELTGPIAVDRLLEISPD